MQIKPIGNQSYSTSSKKAAVSDQSFETALKSVSQSDRFDQLFIAAGEKWGVPAPVLKAIAKAESGFNPQAQSPAGALGMMQLMPDTARALGVQDPYDAKENVFAGARYFRSMLDRFGGDTKLALAAYNAGPGNVQKYNGVPPFKETQRYVQKIMSAIGETLTDLTTTTIKSTASVPNPEIISPAALADADIDANDMANYLKLWSEMRIAKLTIKLDDESKSL